MYIKVNERNQIVKNSDNLWDYFGIEGLEIRSEFLKKLNQYKPSLEHDFGFQIKYAINFGDKLIVSSESKISLFNVPHFENITNKIEVESTDIEISFDEKILSLFYLNLKVYVLLENTTIGNKQNNYFTLRIYSYNTIKKELKLSKSHNILIANKSFSSVQFHSDLIRFEIPLLLYNITQDHSGFIDLNNLDRIGAPINKQISGSENMVLSNPFLIEKVGSEYQIGLFEQKRGLFHKVIYSKNTRSIKVSKYSNLNKIYSRDKIHYISTVHHDKLMRFNTFKLRKAKENMLLLIKTHSKLHHIPLEELSKSNINYTDIEMEFLPNYIKNSKCSFIDASSYLRLILQENNSKLIRRLNGLKYEEIKTRGSWTNDDYIS